MFEPTAQAAKIRLSAVNPHNYSTTRNALGGAVTRLSPYITHGILTVPEAVSNLLGRYRLTFDDKIIFELAWREFFHHVWHHLGDEIFSDIRPACWQGQYADQMPSDVVTGTTGVPAIDLAVAELYATGYLHNHARMWVASYLVHFRKVSWRVGAQWMYSHLIDGDLGSNHLSWQWVAATFSAKAYLFNAENVAKFAPPAWHSKGTTIDRDYALLEDMAKSQPDVGPESEQRRKFSTQQAVPETFGAPPADLLGNELFKDWPKIDVAGVPKKGTVHLVHPWNMSEYLVKNGGRKQRLGIIHLPFHEQHRWNFQRWQFVLTRMKSVTDMVFIGDATTLVPQFGSVHCKETYNPGYQSVLAQVQSKADLQLDSEARQFFNPSELCTSFTKFYASVQRSTNRLMPVVDQNF
jgi:deoxyribodipyrimidine photo-lyase